MNYILKKIFTVSQLLLLTALFSPIAFAGYIYNNSGKILWVKKKDNDWIWQKKKYYLLGQGNGTWKEIRLNKQELRFSFNKSFSNSFTVDKSKANSYFYCIGPNGFMHWSPKGKSVWSDKSTKCNGKMAKDFKKTHAKWEK